MMPAWHDKPTEPGLWLRIEDGSIGMRIKSCCFGATRVEIMPEAITCNGPIPPDNASGVGNA